MAAKDIIKHQFKKGDKRASEAGKKSKRRPDFKTIVQKIFDSKTREFKDLTEDKFIASQIKNGIRGNAALAKEINDRFYGKQAEQIEQQTTVVNLSKKEYEAIRKKMLKEDDV